MALFRKACTSLCAAILAFLTASPTMAATIVLDFEGINPSGVTTTNILDFYNGGTSSAGTSGSDYGVSFSGNALALCLNTADEACSNTSRGGLGDPSSQKGGLIWLEGVETYLNYAKGFKDGFSFYYSAPYFTGGVSVYDGLNGTGNLLGTIVLGLTTNSGCGSSAGGAAYCPFAPVGLEFAGVAKSISFNGTQNYIVFDDVTFGSATPGAVPEVATWLMLIAGIGVIGYAMRRQRSPAAGLSLGGPICSRA